MQEARSIEKILEDLKTERSKVDQAISALETLTSTNGHSTRRRWHMSPEARARISKSMKARWKQRKAA